MANKEQGKRKDKATQTGSDFAHVIETVVGRSNTEIGFPKANTLARLDGKRKPIGIDIVNLKQEGATIGVSIYAPDKRHNYIGFRLFSVTDSYMPGEDHDGIANMGDKALNAATLADALRNIYPDTDGLDYGIGARGNSVSIDFGVNPPGQNGYAGNPVRGLTFCLDTSPRSRIIHGKVKPIMQAVR